MNNVDPLELCAVKKTIDFFDPYMKDAYALLQRANIALSTMDLVPIGAFPTIPQAIGTILDFGAFYTSMAVISIDLGLGKINILQYVAAWGLNSANLWIGQVGNIGSGPVNIGLSLVETAILGITNDILNEDSFLGKLL